MEEYKFKNFISRNKSDDLEKLNMTHLTEFYNIREILSKGMLDSTYCEVFKEKLLYFFYGRPAYRIGKEKKNTSQKAFHPICLIFDYSVIQGVKRIFPFDSGGFKYYHNFLHPKSQLTDYELGNSLSSVDHLINFFYSSCQDYYDDNPKLLGNEVFEWAFEVESYYAMISNKSVTSDDERNSSIEIQLESNINLKNLKAIIFPKQEESTMEVNLKKLGIDCELYTYYLSGITNPNDYFSKIKEIVRNL